MANLFELTNRRKRAREFADRFREGANEAEREYFDQYYQEPSASPLLQKTELTRQLDEGEGLKRQLMARGMNDLQAQDAVERENQARQAGQERLTQNLMTTQATPGSVSYGEGYGKYRSGLDDSMGQDTEPLTADEWSRQRAIEMGMAQDRQRDAAARAASGTVDQTIELAQAKLEETQSKLPAIQADSKTAERVSQMQLKNIDIIRTSKDPAEIQKALTDMDNINRILGKGSRSAGMPGYGPATFVDEELEQELAKQESGSQQSPALTGDSGSQFRLRPQRVEARSANE